MSKPSSNFQYYLTASSVITNSGAGYVVGNTLRVVGGTFTIPATILVTGITGGGAITTFSIATPIASYSVLPTNPVSFTNVSGTGTGAMMTAQWVAANPGFTTLQHYGTSTAGLLPAVGTLNNRELYIDTATPALYVGNSLGVATRLTNTMATQAANAVAITGGTVAVSANPTTGLQVATKQYVDAIVTGTVTNVSLSSPASLAFSIATPTTTPVISFSNVGVTPTAVFLRGDGTWVAPSSITNAGGWAVAQVATKLNFSYNGVLVASLGSNGLFTSANNIVAFSTP